MRVVNSRYRRSKGVRATRHWYSFKVVELSDCIALKHRIEAVRREISYRCKDVQLILGTCGYVVSGCTGSLPEGLREVRPKDLAEVAGFGVERFVYQYGSRILSQTPLEILSAGPYEDMAAGYIRVAVLYSRYDDLEVFSKYLSKFGRLSAARGYEISIERDSGGWIFGNPLGIFLQPQRVSRIEDLDIQRFVSNGDFDVYVVLHEGLLGRELFGMLKRNSIVERGGGCRERISKLQIVDVSKIKDTGGDEQILYHGVNLLHALFFKAGFLPYRLKVADSKVSDVLNNALYVGIALRKTKRGYIKGMAALVTGNFSVFSITRGHILGKSGSMEMGDEEISNFIKEIYRSITHVKDKCGIDPRLVVVIRSRRFNDEELATLGAKIDEYMLEDLHGDRLRVLLTGYSKTKYSHASGSSVFLLRGENGFVALYGAPKFRNLVRLEFTGWNFDHDELTKYALLSYEFSRRLNVWNPFPLYSTIPASLSLARRYLSWESV